MTLGFGRRLRHERERRGVSLQSITARTKIQASIFEALERDDVSRWPSGIFRRSFLRAYAEAVGLDPESTLREFLECFPDPAEHRIIAENGNSTAAGAPRDAVLTLTLSETGVPFAAGRILPELGRRWAAVAWDAGIVTSAALTFFVAIDRFWTPLGISMFCYYIGGILILGNTPGVCLFAPRPHDEKGVRPLFPSESVSVIQSASLPEARDDSSNTRRSLRLGHLSGGGPPRRGPERGLAAQS